MTVQIENANQWIHTVRKHFDVYASLFLSLMRKLALLAIIYTEMQNELSQASQSNKFSKGLFRDKTRQRWVKVNYGTLCYR